VVAVGAGAAVLITLALVMLVAGLFGAAPLHVPGFPDFGKQADDGGQVTTPGSDISNPLDTTGASAGDATTAAAASADASPTSQRRIPTQTPSHQPPPKPTKT
jgi:hypothetical protein